MSLDRPGAQHVQSCLMRESLVFVDLTTEKVVIEAAPKKMRM